MLNIWLLWDIFGINQAPFMRKLLLKTQDGRIFFSGVRVAVRGRGRKTKGGTDRERSKQRDLDQKLFFPPPLFPCEVWEKWTLELWFSFFCTLYYQTLSAVLETATPSVSNDKWISQSTHKSFLIKYLLLVLGSFFCKSCIWFTVPVCNVMLLSFLTAP